MNAAAQAAAPTRPQMLVAAAFAAACLPRLIDPGQSPGQRLDSAPSRAVCATRGHGHRLSALEVNAIAAEAGAIVMPSAARAISLARVAGRRE